MPNKIKKRRKIGSMWGKKQEKNIRSKSRREIRASDISKKGRSWKNRDREKKREEKKLNDPNNKLKINDEKK